MTVEVATQLRGFSAARNGEALTVGATNIQGDETLAPHPTLVILIPAHNEDRFIGSVILKAREYTSAVVVVDDGSHDDTPTVAKRAGAMVLRHDANQGKAGALSTGLSCIRELWPDAIVVVLDADGQHHPRAIPALIQPIQDGQADIVVGSRFLQVRSDIPRWRVFGQSALTTTTNLLSGYALTDSQSGFRAFSPNVVRNLRFRQRGFSVESEMQFIAREHGWKIAEVPIQVVYAERAKRNPVTHGMQVLNGILRLTGQMRPLLFFGVPGIFVLLAGLALGSHVVSIYDATQELAVGYALITVMLTIVGTLSSFTGLILHSIRGLILQATENRRVA